ncbi:unnamed protein product [marine sediment metagenome]|uniref:Uncharacterized protein n=1 Tax=marine sediment metagenome TaxID=412755 RepID=X0UBQ2_9ZZZZ
MKRLVAENRKLARKHSIAVIAIHHTGHLKTDEAGEYVDVRPTGGASIRNDANFEFKVLRHKNKKDQVRITCTKMRSRVAKIHAGDEWIMRYDYATTYMRQVSNALQLCMAMAKFLATKYGTAAKAAHELDITDRAMQYYIHGQREPKPEIKQKLEALCKEAGYVPRLADLT